MNERNNEKFIQFRFIPTMSCNVSCSYCFLSKEQKMPKEDFFTYHSCNEWIQAMKNFKDFDVEFYMWGGEPFSHEKTYEVVKGFAEYDFVSWARADTNLTFAYDIAKKCPTNKLRLNCSWHTHLFDFDEMWKRVNVLNDLGMVCMVNFVATKSNLKFIEKYNFKLDELVKKFYDKGIYLNIAPDFGEVNDLKYKEFVTKYLTPLDYEYIFREHSSLNIECEAGKHLFTIQNNGNLTTCARKKGEDIVGNFFSGELLREKTPCPLKDCLSIVSYAYQNRNTFLFKQHLDEYRKRNIAHRLSCTNV